MNDEERTEDKAIQELKEACSVLAYTAQGRYPAIAAVVLLVGLIVAPLFFVYGLVGFIVEWPFEFGRAFKRVLATFKGEA